MPFFNMQLTNLFMEYLKFFEQVIWYNLVWCRLRLIKCKLYQTRLYRITCSKISNIPYNKIFTTKFNDSSILITIISYDYLNFPLASEYVDENTISTQFIEDNQNFLQVDQPIRLHYSNQIKSLQNN